ncbi:DUF4430 domain-containing protein [uncultured Lactobacillus sp.]|uniref:DUF4430 domain-containing protein n=1 Tax=uncultured Lactobacillus sp. TaxID=153152 RepID=UPI0025D70D3D|nr:DUF4430 domain-containing protein [uncultured Lactobacillus sp.]
MKKSKLPVIASVTAIFAFSLSDCQNNQTKPKSKTNNISVSYVLAAKNDTEKKTVKVPQKSTVMTGLKKAWKVDSNKGFITAIDGKKQNAKKQIYWTYTINGKYATKGANQQKVANKDKVKFTLAKMK